MCVGGNSIEIDDSMVSGRRDTSNELIKSKYALSEENKKRNKDIMSARNRARALVAFNTGGDDGGVGDGVVIYCWCVVRRCCWCCRWCTYNIVTATDSYNSIIVIVIVLRSVTE